jgi:hypothetical protein
VHESRSSAVLVSRPHPSTHLGTKCLATAADPPPWHHSRCHEAESAAFFILILVMIFKMILIMIVLPC